MNSLLSRYNLLFTGVRRAARIPYAIFAILFSIALVFGSALFAKITENSLIFPLLGGEQEINQSATLSGLSQLLREIVQWVPMLLVLWFFVRYIERRSFRTLGFIDPLAFKRFAIGAAVGFTMMASWAGLAYAFGGVTFELNLAYQSGSAASIGLLLAGLSYLLQGPSEEILFRGWLMPIVGIRWKPWIGLLIPAIIFGLLHAMGNHGISYALANIALFGVFFGLYALFQESIWGVMGFHWMYNWTQFNLLGLDVTPENTLGGSVLNLAYTSDAPFATAGFVAEDGPLMTLLLLSGCIVLIVLAVRRQRGEDTVVS